MSKTFSDFKEKIQQNEVDRAKNNTQRKGIRGRGRIEERNVIDPQKEAQQPKKRVWKKASQQKPVQPMKIDQKTAIEHENILQKLLKQREKVEENLKNLEDELYSFEENFLEETAEFGNVVKGTES
ncbi:hypothetical protein DICVIV_14121 [Dictyocaulus viviparus]|uniref:Chromatin modification-related protein MEAF6 n=1 Tax=Dictyocaulus viviparus TaxID=29172 RepID=A0A0D8X8K4_DICVI|nr:hypothetical protein DICVIV_14121 [Dictyocaulus viviparus]